MSDEEFIVWYDLETSGLWPKKYNIIQIAAIATERLSLKTVEKFECKLQFNEQYADANALKGNSYSKVVWAMEAISSLSAFDLLDNFFNKYKSWKRISSRTGEAYEVVEVGGHNLQFDNDFLKEFYKRCTGNSWTGTSAWRGGYIDTLDIAKTIQVMSNEHWEEGFQLGVLCKKFNVKLDNAHDAMADVEATIELYKKLRETIIINNAAFMSEPLPDPEELLVTTEFINDR